MPNSQSPDLLALSDLLPKHVFIDGRKLGDGGIGASIELFIEGMLELYELSESSVRFNLLATCRYIDSHPENIRRWEEKGGSVFVDNTSKYSLSELFFLPLRWRKKISKCDWYISPHYTLPYLISCKKAVIIHDVIHLQHPERLFKKLIAKQLIASALKRADRVFTVSETAKERILEIFPYKKLLSKESQGIVIMPNASVFDFPKKIATTFDNNRKLQLLWVSADRAHKRLDFYLEFLNRLKQIHVDFHASIISSVKAETISKIKKLGLTEFVTLRSNLAASEYAACFEAADCLMTTSIEEGFGIPILEAMRSRISVLCPDLPYARELAGDTGWFYHPFSIDDAVFKFSELVLQNDQRNERLEKGYLRSKSYSPLSMAKIFFTSLSNK